MPEIGDKVSMPVHFGYEYDARYMTGTVVYVHPAGRFFSVEFWIGEGERRRSFRESYPMPDDPRIIVPEGRRRPGAFDTMIDRREAGSYLESETKKKRKHRRTK